jgi:DNA modification methylase
MAIITEEITDRYAIYNGDCIEVMGAMPDESIHFSIYSPPFGGLYHYSSDDRDLSNTKDYNEFFKHYAYFLKELYRVTMPGRITAVHTMDFPSGNSGVDTIVDFTGDVIRAYEKEGFRYTGRYTIWKEPLRVRNKTMAKNLMHRTLTEDSSRVAMALPDYLITFRRRGDNSVPIEHPNGLLEYIGERKVPHELLPLRGYKGSQLENRYSHWVWRQYASCVWDDIRFERMLPFKEAKDEQDEKHVHPLQLDVIERALILWSNENETVLTPFMGVGSEVYCSLLHGRKGVGIELKESYYRQAVMNVQKAYENRKDHEQLSLQM